MTISSEDRSTLPFAGNGVATQFPFTFKVFATSDLVVVKTDAAQVDTTLVLDSDYSVSLNADQDNNPGGTITYPISGSPLATGESLIAYGDISYLQPADIVNQSGFYPRVVENGFDRLTMLIQQVLGLARRAIRVPVSAQAVDTELPDIAERANKVIAFDGDGNVIVSNKTLLELEGNADIREGSRTTQQYVATAGQTSVDTIYEFIPGTDQVAVNVNGSRLVPGVDYEETDPNTITFTQPLQEGDAVLVELFGRTTNFVDAVNVGYRGRTVADRLNDTINVKDYGAIGDGNSHPLSERYATLLQAQTDYPHAVALTDEIDWAAAQAAINAASTYSAGQNVAVYFPFGTFRVNRTLRVLRSRVVLRGADMYGTRLLRNTDYGDTVYFADASPTTTRIFFVGISDMTLEMDAEMNSGAHLHFSDANTFNVQNIHMLDGFVSMRFRGCQNGVIDNTIIKVGTYYPTVKAGAAFVQIQAPQGGSTKTTEVLFSNFNWTRTITANSAVDIGLDIREGDGVWFSNGHIMGATTDLRIAPATVDTQLTGMHFTQVWFDGFCDKNVSIVSNSTSGYGDITFNNCIGMGARTLTFEIGGGPLNLTDVTLTGGQWGTLADTGTRIFDINQGRNVQINAILAMTNVTLPVGSHTAVAVGTGVNFFQMTGEIGTLVGSSPWAIGLSLASTSALVTVGPLMFRGCTQTVTQAGALQNGSKLCGISTDLTSNATIPAAASISVDAAYDSIDITTSSATINDIVGARWSGREIVVRSNGVSTTFAHNAGSAGSLIRTSTGANVTITSGQYAILKYHAQSGSWWLRA